MKKLNDWFLMHKRAFPWRENITPYRVWISEVMLQQTRASAAIPYFERWMKLFPDVSTLAGACIDEVIKAWEGLGYYSRARNLHAGAKQIMSQFGGKIPSTREELLQISGLGPYTSAAILSFGFKQRAAPVDGNVLRVMSRYFWVKENIDKGAVKKKIETLTEGVLDWKEPWVTAEGLIELGATICLPKPNCGECPVRMECKAALQTNPGALPIRSERERTEKLVRGVALIEANGAVLVRKNEPGEIMADLYEFPYFQGVHSQRQVKQNGEKLVGASLEIVGKLSPVVHTFTRYRVQLYPYRFSSSKMDVAGYRWVSIEALADLPFSSGHRKIAQERCNFSKSLVS